MLKMVRLKWPDYKEDLFKAEKAEEKKVAV